MCFMTEIEIVDCSVADLRTVIMCFMTKMDIVN